MKQKIGEFQENLTQRTKNLNQELDELKENQNVLLKVKWSINAEIEYLLGIKDQLNKMEEFKQERHVYYTDVTTYEETQMNSEIVDW